MFQTKAITKLAAPIASRTYASVASASNGIKVASVADASESPLASISLVINAGSRFETAENSGVAHYLKAFGFRNTQSRTSFRTVREAELNGASLTAEATRENIIYTVECFKEAIPYFADVLGDIATATKYTEHEFRDIAKLVAFESLSARSSPATRLVEGVHQAAFRNGLGNSLYALESSPVASGDAVRQYAEAALTAGRVAIVGTGIDSAALAAIVSESKLAAIPASSASTLSTPASKFNGGVQQIYDSASSVSHYALAFEGAQDASTTRVLANLLSGERRLKWNTGVSPLAKLAAEEGFGLQSFQSSYSDASLVGVVVSAPNAKIQEAVEKVARTIQTQIASPSAETVQRAVAAAKVDVSEALATRAGKRAALAQAAFGRAAEATESVDAAAAQAASAAAKAFKSKPVGAAVGLSQATPYVDTLGF
ncbi:ubiquinol-cytochrome c reductase core subunit 1 [Linderina macrospora]|uniref:Ubiquinol-cytochrome c reductase core subunit 1 n=1 Tax=Linderina macrospora TaxID=4868 RepID=A0ACC1JBD2_9FUNG|nr:ubiquinol-cytochrome c reductase core subunit 1 [Linderina macrospora]